jgi:hypothetical protein
MGKIFFGLHVPKCAGTSVLSELKKIFGDDIYQSTSLISNFRNEKEDLLDNFPNLPFKGYFGHHFCDELLKVIKEEIFLFTFLRNPVERALSDYKYINRMNLDVGLAELDFEKFVERVPSMTSFIVDRFPGLVDKCEAKSPRWKKAASVLKKFDYVGDSSDLTSFQSVFKKEFGVDLDLSIKKNKAPTQESKGDFYLKEKLYTALEEDILLYQWVKELWADSREECDNSKNISLFSKQAINEDRLYNFHARSLIVEFKANNEQEKLNEISFKNKTFENILKTKLKSTNK